MSKLALLGAMLVLGLFTSGAKADGGAAQYRHVPVCDGTYGPLNPSGPSTLTYDSHGQLCVVGAGGGGGGGATGGFTPTPAFSSLTVTNVSASGALPTGSSVIFYNLSTKIVSCTLGIGSATATPGMDAIQPNSSFTYIKSTFTVGACINQDGTATSGVVVMSGGVGGVAGSGGGGGAGGGGGPATIADCANTVEGCIADPASYAGSGSATLDTIAKSQWLLAAATQAAPAATLPAKGTLILVGDGGTGCAGSQCTIVPTSLATGLPGAPAVGQVISSQPPWFPTTAIATGTTGAVTATLAIVANKTNFICGVDVSAIGGSAAVSPITITGLLNGTFTYQGVVSSTGGVNFTRNFGTSGQCIPASGTGVAIAVVTTAAAGATAVDVQAWGYYQ
jgi:hypothetical protein